MKRVYEIEVKGFFKTMLKYFKKPNLISEIIKRFIIIEGIQKLKDK